VVVVVGLINLVLLTTLLLEQIIQAVAVEVQSEVVLE
jgi:hypothetical protein